MNHRLELPKERLEAEVKSICKRYKIAPQTVRDILEQNFSKHPQLIQKILERHNYEDVTRFKAYKQVIKETKKQVYYSLRQYHQDKTQEKQRATQLTALLKTQASSEQINQAVTELLLTHVSTQERVEYYQAFYEQLFSLIEPPTTIIDIGCGLHPLSYSFNNTKKPMTYVAIDKDNTAIEYLKTFSSQVQPKWLRPICADIAQLDWLSYLNAEAKVWDLAFMLKLIPVVHRQNNALFAKLAEVPARQILVTASTEAMTRKENIMRREDKVLREFIQVANKKVIAHFRIANEFGYLLE
jgi:16S rRNA (guanine(1405)-N(7))-methyltransferase